ncbi:DUF6519 domain-containing protein [Streptomyces sp. NBC_01445]|uniref:DUF6519 domain-containing protein n=1 Tax=Streptomyces sp. NBC_01445 TaxID=2903869 RepID=UPI002DDBA43D|nr:DUF6519 domain-containing protein [Streptomyces sp. NBC_01445]WSE03770.1 DUF6519 domain-containing protein [Streptomyces sp. NBC_01445]
MAVISTDTFDPLKRYVRVRLQQGVPIVDADVNEREDIQKFELRAFLKWFVGDGVPEGNEGFRIKGESLENDFWILSGVSVADDVDPLSRVGRCLVDGLDVMIELPVRYAAQKLHECHGAAAAELAARWGVPVVPALDFPAADTVLVYLDVWERMVMPADEAELIHSGLGIETCARLKREWVVRTRAGDALPAPSNGHVYTALATIRRRESDKSVQPDDITDRRQRRLLVPPASLIEDVLGVDPMDYRRGLKRPPISLRDAINALLRGELPTTPDAPVEGSGSSQAINRAFAVDGDGLVAVWSAPAGGSDQVFAARMDLADVRSGFIAPPHQLTSVGRHMLPHAVPLPGGDLLVAYQSGTGPNSDVLMKRGPLPALASKLEIPVADTPNVAESAPFLTVTEGLVTVFFSLTAAATSSWHYRRQRHTSGTWEDTEPRQLSALKQISNDFHAAVDSEHMVWAAFRAEGTGSNDIRVLRFDPTTAAVRHEESFDSGAADEQPFVLCTRGDTWVFWTSRTTLNSSLRARRFHNNAWQPIETIPTPGDTNATKPCAVEDADGAVWLMWRASDAETAELMVMRRDPESGEWHGARQLTRSLGNEGNDNDSPFALVAPDKAIWIFWARAQKRKMDQEFVTYIYHKRLVTVV